MNITWSTAPASPSLPCAMIGADGVVSQLRYNAQGDVPSSSAPDGNGSQVALTTFGYDGDGEQTSVVAPDGNLSGANAGNYTTVTAWNADGDKTSVTEAGGSGATVTPRVSRYGYDANSNATTVQDARGYTATPAYNANDKPALVTPPNGHATLTPYAGELNTTQNAPPPSLAAAAPPPTP